MREYAQPSETETADIGNPPPFQWFGPRFFFFFSSNIGDRDQGMLGAVAKLQKAIVDEHELHAPSAASAACKMQRWAPYACSQLPEQPEAFIYWKHWRRRTFSGVFPLRHPHITVPYLEDPLGHFCGCLSAQARAHRRAEGGRSFSSSQRRPFCSH